MNYGIYLIINVVSHKEYIGSSKSLKRREYQHWYELKRGIHGNPHLQNSYKKYGKQSFHFVVLEYCEPENLKDREDWWIDLLDTMAPNGYNLVSADRHEVSEETRDKLSANARARGTWIGQYTKGYIKSPEARAKQSASLKGKTLTPEHKAKLSVAQKGRTLSQETKAKLSNIAKGRTFLPETKAKLSAANKGRTPWNKGKSKITKGDGM